FVSSSSRPTRFLRDWSPDVCSSDLPFRATHPALSFKPARVERMIADYQLHVHHSSTTWQDIMIGSKDTAGGLARQVRLFGGGMEDRQSDVEALRRGRGVGWTVCKYA